MIDSLFHPVLDISEGTFTANQVQGIFGLFMPVLDDAQGAAVAATARATAFMTTNTGMWGY